MAGAQPEKQRTVLVAVDASPQAQEAFEWYLANVYRTNDRVILIHSAEPPFVNSSQAMCMSSDLWDQMLHQEKEKARHLEEKYTTIMKEHEVPGTIRVIFHAKAGEVICEAANEENANLIVMGTRGLGTVRRTIMGSVSDYVVHHARCPIAVCRHKPKHP